MSERATVLVVDDDASARQTLEAILYREAYDVLFASSAAGAFEHLVGSSVDLVICDVMMPGTDGFAVCRAIKAHPEWRFVPTILVTALDGRDDTIRGLEAGADDFLSKPLEGAVLRARARAMLRVRGQYGELRVSPKDEETLLGARRARLIESAGLSEREKEVLDFVLLGRAHQDIATALGISERTSKFHQANLLKKLGAESRLDLLRLFA